MNKQDLGHIDVDKSDDEITDNMSKKDVPLTQEEIRQFVKQQVDKLTKQNGKQADGFSPEAKEKDEENKKIELAKKKEVDKRNALINKRKKEVAAEQKKGRRKMKRGIPKTSGGIPKRGGSVAKSKSKEKEGSNTLTVFADESYLPLVNNFVKIDGMYPLITDDYLKSNLDSYSVGQLKSPNSLLMHSMYAVSDIGYGPELLKLYVEEMNDPNSVSTGKRAYQLQNIEKASAVAGGVQGTTPSSLATTTNAIRTVADLYASVKDKRDERKD